MLIRTIALWNAAGEVRRIDLEAGLNVITGESQTGKSALIDIIRYCLGSTTLRVPAGPIAANAAYYGLSVQIGSTHAFLGRPALGVGQETGRPSSRSVSRTSQPPTASRQTRTPTPCATGWAQRSASRRTASIRRRE